MDDLISRKAAIDTLCDFCNNVRSVCPHYPCKQHTAIDALPPVKPKKGWWGEFVPGLYRCSECGRFNPTQENFCPDCGADMRREEWRPND